MKKQVENNLMENKNLKLKGKKYVIDSLSENIFKFCALTAVIALFIIILFVFYKMYLYVLLWSKKK